MPYVIIFHGTGGDPKENWFPWLKEKLKEHGYKTTIPQFPTPKNQTPETWFNAFEKYEDYLNEKTILIGHSLGGAFLLRVLEKIPVNVKLAVFVAASIGVKPIKYYEGDKPFVEAPFDWKNIKSRAENFLVFHSEDDSLVCIGNGEKLAKELGTELIRAHNAGHFNEAAGFKEFPLLLEKLIPFLQEKTIKNKNDPK